MHNELPRFLTQGQKSSRTNFSPYWGLGVYRPWLSAWTIKLILIFGWYRKPRPNRMPEMLVDDDVLKLIGIDPILTDEEGDIETVGPAVRKCPNSKIELRLLTRLEEIEEKQKSKALPLFANIERLGNILGLTDEDKIIFLFTAAFSLFTEFEAVISARSERVSNDQLAAILHRLTGHSESGLRKALGPESSLISSGIVSVKSSIRDIESKLVLMDGLGGRLLQAFASDQELTEQFLKPVAKGTLALEAYPHLKSDIAISREFLEGVLKNKTPGSNILFYGTPGTGKTEMANALAKALDVEIFEVAFSDAEGDPIRGEARLRAYSLCQRLLARRANVILMFDEIEDVFPSSGGLLSMLLGGDVDNGESLGKAWINRTLENNPVPAIWITNNSSIDAAYLRRFDYSIGFPIPPQKVRLSIARHHLQEFNPPEEWLERIAANESVSPAQYQRAAKVARHAAKGKKLEALGAIELSIDRSMTLLGQKRMPARNSIRTGYDLRFLNTDIDIPKLIAGLHKRPSVSACMYGAPGTGKTELARQIADELGKPLLVRRASDILSMWVGESEKQIARMFAEARQQDAVLVLDEADSFLADRRGANNSWEVTQVNELLTQMEAFEGIFIATTNLLERLDQACLRRFSVKVKFDYMHADQTWTLFQQEFERLGGDPQEALPLEGNVRSLKRVAPGDFSAIVKQIQLWDQRPTAHQFLDTLRREIVVKGGTSSTIGFVS